MIQFFTPLIVIIILLTLTWLIALKIEIGAIVDIFWAASFGIMAIVSWLLIAPHHMTPIPMLILFLIVIWSFRLALHLTFRIFRHGKKEDSRYAALKKKWGSRAPIKLLMFYQAQGILIFILSLIFPLVFFAATLNLNFQHIIGIALGAIAIIGETLSDKQLTEYKKRAPQSICNIGMWQYSRHPNYFFQWLAWCAWAILATNPLNPISWLAWLAPTIMYGLLRYVSGIPLTEKLMLEKYGQNYQAYLDTTPPFFPLPRFKNN